MVASASKSVYTKIQTCKFKVLLGKHGVKIFYLMSCSSSALPCLQLAEHPWVIFEHGKQAYHWFKVNFLLQFASAGTDLGTDCRHCKGCARSPPQLRWHVWLATAEMRYSCCLQQPFWAGTKHNSAQWRHPPQGPGTIQLVRENLNLSKKVQIYYYGGFFGWLICA